MGRRSRQRLRRVRESSSFYAFLTLATAIAAVAVVTDSSILVVGAMVVGPEFGLVAALAVGLAARRVNLVGGAALLLLKGFTFAIAATVVLALVGLAVGWVQLGDVTGPRPLTGSSGDPTSGPPSSLFSPAAPECCPKRRAAQRPSRRLHLRRHRSGRRDIALSLTMGAPGHLLGSASQLVINLLGMTIAGVATLLAQRALWSLRSRPRAAS